MSVMPMKVGLLCGREYSFPFASSLLLSALCAWLVYALQ